MSRDPEDGKPIDPKSLHKYLYANGDPINAIDPTGHEALIEYVVNLANRVQIYTQIYVPTYIGTLQFYGAIAATLASVTAYLCEITDGCGPQGQHPAPGGFGEGGEPGPAPGGAGAQH